jgi:protease-4
VYQQFVEVVVAERNLPVERLEQVADGRILSGRQAVGHGLIDRLGNFNDAVATAGRMAGLGEDPVLYRPRKHDVTLLDVLLGRALPGSLTRLVKTLENASFPRLKFAMPR